MDNILDQLKTFIINQRWEYDFPITREKSLQYDLLIYGGDTDEFIHAFSKQFNVEIYEFRIGDYFRGEGGFFPDESPPN